MYCSKINYISDACQDYISKDENIQIGTYLVLAAAF